MASAYGVGVRVPSRLKFGNGDFTLSACGPCAIRITAPMITDTASVVISHECCSTDERSGSSVT